MPYPDLDDKPKRKQNREQSGGSVQREVKPLAVIEVMFRGKWTPVYEVAGYKTEVGWNMTLSEPINQMRVVYQR